MAAVGMDTGTCRASDKAMTATFSHEPAVVNLRHIVDLMRQGHWRPAHDLVQEDTSPMAAWLHGILHLQEGDLEDAEYWYGKADQHFRSRGTLEQELERFEAALHT